MDEHQDEPVADDDGVGAAVYEPTKDEEGLGKHAEVGGRASHATVAPIVVSVTVLDSRAITDLVDGEAAAAVAAGQKGFPAQEVVGG